MDIPEHLAALRREGDLLADAAARTDLDAPIPTCPDWRMKDLVRHIGDVHRWAAAHVAERRTQPIRRIEEAAGLLPEDGALLDWYREGHTRLLQTLETADPGLECWTFLPAPSSLAFWARRQAHETGIHRVDAESPGDAITRFDPRFAVDGIEEMLFGFLAGSGIEADPDAPRMIGLHATDAKGEWTVLLGTEAAWARPGDHGPGDCFVEGAASDLYLLLWNRRSADGLEVSGDRSVLDRWRQTMQVRWGGDR